MKVGSIGYATEQGLGILLKSFYDAKIVTDVAVIHHGRRVTHLDWYPGINTVITNLKHPTQIRHLQEFCKRMDVVLFFETPFIWELIPYCKSVGVRTVMMPMYECMPERWPYQPDAILNPSLLDQEYYPNGTFIPVPVDLVQTSSVPVEGITHHPRSVAKVFVHNAGHGGLLGRNGTAELLQAMRRVKSDAKLIVRMQDPQNFPPYPELLGNTVLDTTVISSRDQLYAEGDVFIFPEKFNGLSLPLQEAAASGMAVMTTARFPNTAHLPEFIRIEPSGYRRNRISGRTVEFDEAVLDPRVIAARIDEVYGTDVTRYSAAGKVWAREMSWEVLRPRYTEFLSCPSSRT